MKSHPKIMIAGLVTLFLLVCLMAGCTNSKPPGPTPQNKPATEESRSTGKKISLFFPGKDALRLHLETREVSLQNKELIPAVFDALISGPRNPEASSLIPSDTRLLNYKHNPADKSLLLDFSHHLAQANVGSSGEILLIYSLVNSFASLDDVQSISILIDGKMAESLSGHVDLASKLVFDASLTIAMTPVELPANPGDIQRAVEQGHQPWRLDPVLVAKEEGSRYGFNPAEDSFSLAGKLDKGTATGTGEAEVLVAHLGQQFVIQLLQPTGPGSNHFWTIRAIQPYRGSVPSTAKG